MYYYVVLPLQSFVIIDVRFSIFLHFIVDVRQIHMQINNIDLTLLWHIFLNKGEKKVSLCIEAFALYAFVGET